MAAPLMPMTMTVLLAATVQMALVTSGANAAPLADPTLPPPALAPADQVAAARPAAPVLQLILGAGEARTALIDGRWVGAGSTVAINGADYRVERVTETTVVLARGAVREELQIAAAASGAVRCRTKQGERCR